jgi:hypothetical protein
VPLHRSGRGFLVAAAVLAVLGVGGLFVAGIARSGGEDSASTESADSATASSTPGAAADERSPAVGLPEAADSAGDGAGAAAPPAPTSTAPPDRSFASTDSIVDLGDHDDIAALLRSLDAGGDGELDTARSADPAVLPCVAQQRGAGIVVLGVATVGDELLVVIEAPSGPQLLDPASCAPR